MSEALTRPQWLKQRAQGIGASEIAGIMNLPGAYANIGEIWVSKIKAREQIGEDDAGIIDPETAQKFDRKSIGLRMEPVILDLYEIANPTFTVRRPGLQLFRHPEYPFIFATIDAEATTEFNDKRTIEAKNVSVFKRAEWGMEGSDDVPPIFAAQGTQQMLVREHLGYGTFCDFPAFFGGNDLKIFSVPYDRELAANIVELCGWFWGLVQRREPPPVDFGWKNATKVYKRIYDQIVGETLIIDEEKSDRLLRLIATRDYAHEQGKRWVGDDGQGGIKGECTAEILSIVGDYARVEIPIPGQKKPVAINRKPKNGYTVASFEVAPSITMSFEPYQLQKRKEVLHGLNIEIEAGNEEEQRKQIGAGEQAGG